MLVLLDFVHIVLDALPHVAVIVCVKLLDCRVTLIICAVLSVPFATDDVDLRGIVLSVKLDDPVQFTELP